MKLYREFEPTYIRSSGLFVVNLQDIPFPENFIAEETSVVSIPPLEKGGNHKHPRVEVLVGMGSSLYFMWKNKYGKLCEEPMNPSGKLRAFTIPSMVPHVVVIRSETENGVLIENASATQTNVEMVELV